MQGQLSRQEQNDPDKSHHQEQVLGSFTGDVEQIEVERRSRSCH